MTNTQPDRPVPDLFESLAIIGVFLMFAGVWMVYPAAAVFGLGALVFWLGLRGLSS